jgi:hypothetical protein
MEICSNDYVFDLFARKIRLLVIFFNLSLVHQLASRGERHINGDKGGRNGQKFRIDESTVVRSTKVHRKFGQRRYRIGTAAHSSIAGFIVQPDFMVARLGLLDVLGPGHLVFVLTDSGDWSDLSSNFGEKWECLGTTAGTLELEFGNKSDLADLAIGEKRLDY